MSYFNSQPHEEADIIQTVYSLICSISTHSLTKRLTSRTQSSLSALRNFNSQPHEEADYIRFHRTKFLQYFNSQPHEEADSIGTPPSNLLQYFNSQPHEEADFRKNLVNGKCVISTHSLTKRLTIKGSINPTYGKISTHSLTKRLTWYSLQSLTQFIISTHSLTKRLTFSANIIQTKQNYFNSQPHEEADEYRRILADARTLFQLTASRRG